MWLPRGIYSSVSSVKGRGVIFTFLVNSVLILAFWCRVYIKISVCPVWNSVALLHTISARSAFSDSEILSIALKASGGYGIDHGSNANEVIICVLAGTWQVPCLLPYEAASHAGERSSQMEPTFFWLGNWLFQRDESLTFVQCRPIGEPVC